MADYEKNTRREMSDEENIVTISSDDPMLSVSAVAKMFSVKPYTVRVWIKEGKIKGHLLSGRWRIQKSEVQRYANELFGENREP